MRQSTTRIIPSSFTIFIQKKSQETLPVPDLYEKFKFEYNFFKIEDENWGKAQWPFDYRSVMNYPSKIGSRVRITSIYPPPIRKGLTQRARQTACEVTRIRRDYADLFFRRFVVQHLLKSMNHAVLINCLGAYLHPLWSGILA